MEKISKFEAASRQLNAAITLLFNEVDGIIPYTLAAAASNVYADILDKKVNAESWREKMRSDNGLSKAQIKEVMNKSWNFLKHGDRDPNGVLEFDEMESLYLIFMATLECGEIQKTSIQMQVFQLWFIALKSIDLADDNQIQQTAKTLFPNLELLPRAKQLSLGAEMLTIQVKGFQAET